SSPARCSRHEPLIVLNGFHALIHRKSIANANTFLPRITHEVEGKLAATEGFHPCKFRLERGIEGVRAWAGVGREEVEVIPVPLRPDVGDVVELRLNGLRQ